jgi:hypothetical protein
MKKGAAERDESKVRQPPRESCAYTASFSSLDGRKATFLLALILIASPVAGLRPIPTARNPRLK